MIEVNHLTKRYGKTVAVDQVSFKVEPGKVTGFLGPNGAGKSTTMRMILGLDAPTSVKSVSTASRITSCANHSALSERCWTQKPSSAVEAQQTTSSG